MGVESDHRFGAANSAIFLTRETMKWITHQPPASPHPLLAIDSSNRNETENWIK